MVHRWVYHMIDVGSHKPISTLLQAADRIACANGMPESAAKQ